MDCLEATAAIVRLSKGFTQPPVLGCYEHQAYFLPDFAALGFISLVDADPAFFGLDASGKPKGSALLALGGALGTPAGVPEPASILLFGSVVTALAGVYRKKLRAQ